MRWRKGTNPSESGQNFRTWTVSLHVSYNCFQFLNYQKYASTNLPLSLTTVWFLNTTPNFWLYLLDIVFSPFRKFEFLRNLWMLGNGSTTTCNHPEMFFVIASLQEHCFNLPSENLWLWLRHIWWKHKYFIILHLKNMYDTLKIPDIKGFTVKPTILCALGWFRCIFKKKRFVVEVLICQSPATNTCYLGD